MIYKYVWGNNEKRGLSKNRLCRIIKRMRLNSALVEFENGQREVVSINTLRKRER